MHTKNYLLANLNIWIFPQPGVKQKFKVGMGSILIATSGGVVLKSEMWFKYLCMYFWTRIETKHYVDYV